MQSQNVFRREIFYDLQGCDMKSFKMMMSAIFCVVFSSLTLGQTKSSVHNILNDSNPSFEGASHDGSIPGWKMAYGQCKIVDDTVAGKKSLYPSNISKIESIKLIRVEPGYRYFMSVRGKYKNFKFLQEGLYGVGYGLEELSGDKNINGNWYGMYSYLKYGEGDCDWIKETLGPIRPKETTVYLRPAMQVKASAGSEVWFDDVVVWKEKLPENKLEGKVNIIENGSFEVRYDMGIHANGFDFADRVGKNSICVEDVKYSGLGAMKISGDCRAMSNAGYLDGPTLEASIAVKTQAISAGKAFAELVFFDKNRKIVKTHRVADLSGTNDWKVYTAELKDLDGKAVFVQWQFGMTKDAVGTAWFDDLKAMVPSTLKSFPHRGKNISKVTVNVDCGKKMETFESPLTAFDHHNSDRVYSPSIGTAGKFVDGPGHWYDQRKRLGFKYVRVHHIYKHNICVVEKNPDGTGKVNFGYARTHWPESDATFNDVAEIDKDGKLITNFDVIKYMLDKSLLVGGCKPIIGLEPVPRCLARDGLECNGPRDYKLWEELNYRFVKFLVDTYGKEEVKTWIFETGNEPGTEPEWHGQRSDPNDTFIKMQDYTVAGATRAFPEIFIAGPSGPPENLMEPMLEHCATGKNYATGKIGTKIDAISYHGYLAGHAGDISWRQAEDQIFRYKGYIDRFYRLTGKKLQLFNTEYTPIFFDGGRDPKNPTHEQNNHIQAIATLHMGFFSHRLGVSQMAFFFHSPIYFAFQGPMDVVPEFQGLPTCITLHGIYNPVCRAYEMMSWLNGGVQVAVEADKDPIFALATTQDKTIKVLCYSFDPAPKVTYTTSVNIAIDPAGMGKKFKVTRYELSENKANSWYLAQQMKLTQADCERDVSVVEKINKDSELMPEDMGVAEVQNEKVHLKVNIPAYSASLFILEKKD
jgi:xylan 1,4-beta-xylosidase